MSQKARKRGGSDLSPPGTSKKPTFGAFVNNPKNIMANQNIQKPTNSQPINSKPSKNKPIFVRHPLPELKAFIKSLTLEKLPTITYQVIKGAHGPFQQAKVEVLSPTDKTTIINKLKEAKIPHFSFTEANQRLPSFVLKGHYHTTLDDMKEILISENLKVKAVKFIKDNVNIPIYLVQFESSDINLIDLNNKSQLMAGCKVRWEALQESKRKFTQCHRCQRWGHSSTNCGFEFRCVACGKSDHDPGKCPRKQLMDEARKDTASCANCGLNHAANYKQCVAFKQYQNFIKSARAFRNQNKNLTDPSTFTVTSTAVRQPQVSQPVPFRFTAPASSQSSQSPQITTSSHQQQKKPANQAKLPIITSHPPEFEFTNIMNHPKDPKVQKRPQIPSYRDKFVNGESASHSHNRTPQTNKCANCDVLSQRVTQLEEQLAQLNNFIRAQFSDHSQIHNG